MKCKERCKQSCDLTICEGLAPEEICCRYKDAVVRIHSETLLTPIPTVVPPAPPVGSGQYSSLFMEGNGFFIKNHVIVCPAHLVLVPPSVLGSFYNRFPFTTGATGGTGGFQYNLQSRVSRILVDVFNVNGKGHSFSYEAQLLGVDGAGDIALLRIDPRHAWNQCNPCILKCHPLLKWGKSRALRCGEDVYAIGDYLTNIRSLHLANGANMLVHGVVSDKRWLDYLGWAFAEMVVADFNVYAYSAGMPILNKNGCVVGMQTTDVVGTVPGVPAALGAGTGSAGVTLTTPQGDGWVGGPSEFFMRRVIKALLCGCKGKYGSQITSVADPAGSFYSFNKGYIGVAYEVVTGLTYDTGLTGTAVAFPSGVLTQPFFQRFTRIASTGATGSFLASPACKELIGIQVVGIAGATGASGPTGTIGYYVPGADVTTAATSPVPLLTASPFAGTLAVGDIITHLNRCPLGDLGQQIPPSLVLWTLHTKLTCTDKVDVTYRKMSENWENFYNASANVLNYPPYMDYPWYKVHAFPAVAPYPLGILPGGSPYAPALPLVNFHPAI